MLATVGDEFVILVQGTVGHAAVEVVGAETLLKSQVYYLSLWASSLYFGKMHHMV